MANDLKLVSDRLYYNDCFLGNVRPNQDCSHTTFDKFRHYINHELDDMEYVPVSEHSEALTQMDSLEKTIDDLKEDLQELNEKSVELHNNIDKLEAQNEKLKEHNNVHVAQINKHCKTINDLRTQLRDKNNGLI